MSTNRESLESVVEPGEAPVLRRLHPLSPVLQSWKWAGAGAAVALGLFRDEVDRVLWVWDAIHGDVELSVLGKAALIVMAAAAVSVVAAWLSWRATGFAVVMQRTGDASLLYHRGLFVRRRSQVRLKRVQSIDVNQPLVARLVGLAEVRLDMAAGDEASVSLAYLGVEQAWDLRAELLRHTSVATGRGAPVGRSAGDVATTGIPASTAASTATGARAPAAPGDVVIGRVDFERLLKASLLEGIGGLIGAVAYFVAVIVVWIVIGTQAFVAALAGILPLTIAVAVFVRNRVRDVLRDANFELMRTPTGLRVSAGLASTINRTVDLDRVQAVRLEEPFLWRRLGWARVTVDVAGAPGKGDDDSARTSLMPVTDRASALALIREVVGPDLNDVDTTPPGRGSRVLDPWGYRFLGVALLPSGALSRSGRLRHTLSFVPYARIQSVTASQGWLQRRCRVATVWLDLPRGGHRWHGQHRDIADAHRLVGALTDRAREHRR